MIFIFDLDMTLVNSKNVEKARDSRCWQKVYSDIDRGLVVEFEGISNLLTYLKLKGHLVGIVTSAPKPYAQKIINRFSWEIDALVCFHDTKRRKPYPDPLLKCLEKFENVYDKVFSLGDRDSDIIASKAANILSVGCLWGSEDENKLIESQPDFLLTHVQDVYNIIS